MQSDYHNLDESDECYELSRLKQSMEMVGFCRETQRRVFAVLSAVVHIGNIEFQPKKSTYHHDESVTVKNVGVVSIIAQLLKVKEEILHQALISKRARASGEMLVINYRMPEVRPVYVSTCFNLNIQGPNYVMCFFFLSSGCGCSGCDGQVSLRLFIRLDRRAAQSRPLT